MSRKFLVLSSAALAAAALLAWRLLTAGPQPPAARSDATTHRATTEEPSGAPAPSAAPAKPPVAVAAPPQPMAPAAEAVAAPGTDEDARLSATLGLRPPGPSSALGQMKRFTVEELDLFARIERKAGKPAPPEVLQIVERRRAGARDAELRELADRLLEHDLLVRATVREWLREQARVQP